MVLYKVVRKGIWGFGDESVSGVWGVFSKNIDCKMGIRYWMLLATDWAVVGDVYQVVVACTKQTFHHMCTSQASHNRIYSTKSVVSVYMPQITKLEFVS